VIFTFKGIEKLSKQMAMRSNGNGLLGDSRAKRTMKGRETWRGEGGREFQILKSFPQEQVKVGLSFAKWGKEGYTLAGFLCRYFLREIISSKEFFGHDLLTIWSPPHLFNPTKVGEHPAFHHLPSPYLWLLASGKHFGSRFICSSSPCSTG
jgi:hypothetical protein